MVFCSVLFDCIGRAITNCHKEISSSSKYKDELKFSQRCSCSCPWQNGAMKTQYDRLVGIALNHFTLGLTIYDLTYCFYIGNHVHLVFAEVQIEGNFFYT